MTSPSRATRPNPMTNDLMSLEEIAEMWRCPYRYARDILVKLPEFPAPAPGSTSRYRVWVREKVLAYARGEIPEPAEA